MFTFVKNESDFQIVAYGFIRTRRDGFIRRNAQPNISTDRPVRLKLKSAVGTAHIVAAGFNPPKICEKVN